MSDKLQNLIDGNSDKSSRELARMAMDLGIYNNLESARSAVRRLRAPEVKETEAAIVQYDFNRALSLDVVHFSNSGLSFDRDLTKDEFRDVLKFTVQCETSSNWWTGDTLVAINDQLGEDAAREAANNFSDPITAWDCFRTCQSIKKEHRSNVSYKIHVAALQECGGNASDAAQYVKLAGEQGWDASDVRRAIREQMATKPVTSRIKGSKTIGKELRILRELVLKAAEITPITEWNLEQVNAFLDDAEPVAEVIETVRDRWAHFNPELKGACSFISAEAEMR